MAVTDYQLTFNRGVVSQKARARADVARIAMSAEEQMNWLPQTLGPMQFRPGTEYIGSTYTTTGAIKHLPFIFSINDTALIEATDEFVRVRVDEVLITRPNVSTTVTNGDFDTDIASWTDADEGADSVSEWVTGGYMRLTGSGVNAARRKQTLTVAVIDQDEEHALRVIVAYGNVTLRVGSATTADDYITETVLGVGEHSLAFTPTGASVYVSVSNASTYPAYLTSVNVESGGVMSFTTGLLPAETLDEIRYAQSGDILFIARGTTRKPVKIERRGTRSWSLVDYLADKGPFLAANTGSVTLAVDAVAATAADPTVTVTASREYFKSTQVGGLLRITSTGQTVSSSLGALDATTNSIRVTGIGDSRRFTIAISGTWVGTIDLEQSIGEEGSWTTVDSWTLNTTETYNDTLDNQIIYYRLKMSAYTSGSATASLSIPTGSITGIGRIITYTSPTLVDVFVLQDFGSTTATSDWAEGAWSSRRGFPSAVCFFEARLYWAGKDHIWGSTVDDYYNYDIDYEGDAGPIDRSIGSGPVDTINWLVPLNSILMGAQCAEHIGRSTGFEEPITPSNFNLREGSTFGSAPVESAKVDSSCIFVDRTGTRVMQSVITEANRVETIELSVLCPELCRPGIKRIAVQRRPETRVHLLRCDGTVVILTFDKVEELKCFTTWETAGLVEDICVIPTNAVEDLVYYTVAREVDGAVVRYLERWAELTEAQGGVINKIADSFLIHNGVSTTIVSGLDYLEGCTVVAWGNSKDLGSYTVASGSITLSEATTYAVVGLSYYANYVSNKLGFNLYGATGIKKDNRVTHLGLVLDDTDADGLEFGTESSYLDSLPPIEEAAAVTTNYLWDSYDQEPVPVNGTFNFDTRLYLKATAPKPCTVVGLTIDMVTAAK